MLQALERALELARHRGEVATLDEARRVAAPRAAPRDLAQQRALADAGAAVDEHDGDVELAVEEPVEEVELVAPTDKTLLIRIGKATGERPRHGCERIRGEDANGGVMPAQAP